jgi:hypothetical protein
VSLTFLEHNSLEFEHRQVSDRGGKLCILAPFSKVATMARLNSFAHDDEPGYHNDFVKHEASGISIYSSSGSRAESLGVESWKG